MGMNKANFLEYTIGIPKISKHLPLTLFLASSIVIYNFILHTQNLVA